MKRAYIFELETNAGISEDTLNAITLAIESVMAERTKHIEYFAQHTGTVENGN